MASPLRVLVADDDREFAELLAEYVREFGHEVVAIVTGGGLEVIRRYGQFQPDVVLLDIMMPRFNGLTVCHALISRDPAAKIIFVSGQVAAGHPFIVGAGAFASLAKPIERQQLEAILGRVAEAISPAQAE
jgi:CheY-like chemotaxis protein